MKRWLIVGLGNPGREYALSRHNIGFLVIDLLKERWGIKLRPWRESLLGEGEGILLAKPLTFMNRSGEAVEGLQREWGIPIERILIVHDDIDLPFGRLRIKRKGGAGGHRGVESIILLLGRDDFPRLKIGIGRPPPQQEVTDYVLGRFSEEEYKTLPSLLERAKDAIYTIISEGLEQAMNLFNG